MVHRFLMAAVGFVALACSAQAEIVTFNLLGPSSLTLSGNAVVTGTGTFPYSAQGAGSLTTTYLGSITVDVTNAMNPTAIVFQSANIDANINGSWLPSVTDSTGPGPATPADYGMNVAAIGGTARLRNVVFNLTAASTAVTAGSFGLTGQSFAYTTGNLDVHSTALMDGNSISLTGNGGNTSTSTGTYSVVGNLATLTIPVTFSVPYTIQGTPLVTGTNTFTGSLIATATVPEPSSLSLLALCGPLFYAGRRRK